MHNNHTVNMTVGTGMGMAGGIIRADYADASECNRTLPPPLHPARSREQLLVLYFPARSSSLHIKF